MPTRRRDARALPVRILGLLLAVAAAGATAQAGTAEDPFASRRADAVYDVRRLLLLAEDGDARAAFILGTRFASGRGATRDDSEAVRWFRRAAESGLAEAQYNLGVMYANGRGVDRDMAQAARWYLAAAEKGVAEAQFNVGTLYGLGIGVPKNEALAAQWLRKAADDELARAQYNLGVLYEHGRGVRLDARAARVWYERAAQQGYGPAVERLASLREKLRIEKAQAPAASAGEATSSASPSGEPVAGGPPADWLGARDPERYTVQLLSHTDEASVRRYLERNFAPHEAGYFASRRGGTTWYSVVWGEFPTYEAAREAVAGLPEDLRTAKPWVRRIGKIQEGRIR